MKRNGICNAMSLNGPDNYSVSVPAAIVGQRENPGYGAPVAIPAGSPRIMSSISTPSPISTLLGLSGITLPLR